MISFIIPSYNNLRHLKNVYASIKRHAPEAEIVLLDDGSTDETWKWMQEQDCIKYRSEKRVGHTILYDKGIELATNEIVGILHADMILGPNYVENLIKHLAKGKVVCATRIEPPLHPEGKEKIIKNFGLDFDSLNIEQFEEYVSIAQLYEKDKTTKGMFAPWIIYKEDFQAIGGHDSIFAPFPYEDSDIFQRWILAGYELIQSRDAFVYHLTCRGHRWTEEVGKDDEYFKQASNRAAKNYLRKWGSWIKNDEYQHPVITPKYDIGFVIYNCSLVLLEMLEPWAKAVYVDERFSVVGRSWDYVEMEQGNTRFDLSKRVKDIKSEPVEDIVVEFDSTKLNQQSFQLIQQLPQIIAESGEIGEFELDIFKIKIRALNTYENRLITSSDQYYTNQLL